MIYKADSSLSLNLLNKPETGMGYQVIDAIKPGRITKDRFVVYNSELIVDFDSEFSDSKKQIINEGFRNILNKSKSLSLESIIVIPRIQFNERRLLTGIPIIRKGRHAGGKGAKENPKENADGKEIFTRLSAYEDDKRIDFANKQLKPGSYTTTLEDYQTCKKNDDDPIDRYALPNDEEIKWAFHIRPKMNDTLQRGIVQPAFGHSGGGIEAYFDDGTSSNTYFQKSNY